MNMNKMPISLVLWPLISVVCSELWPLWSVQNFGLCGLSRTESSGQYCTVVCPQACGPEQSPQYCTACGLSTGLWSRTESSVQYCIWSVHRPVVQNRDLSTVLYCGLSTDLWSRTETSVQYCTVVCPQACGPEQSPQYITVLWSVHTHVVQNRALNTVLYRIRSVQNSRVN
jgi:hypothetical protein